MNFLIQILNVQIYSYLQAQNQIHIFFNPTKVRFVSNMVYEYFNVAQWTYNG
jgi:hypothetical protein